MKTPALTLLALSVMSGLAAAQDKPIQKDEQDVERLVITASPLNRSVLESATPVSIVAGNDLKSRAAPTLGETLKNIPGVHSSYFGPVASSPVIRGLDGPRIKVVQNGLDVSDASRVGPDHVVSTEVSSATQIEVLRGPATLLYGSGAIGGVVNVVDNRLPTTRREEVSGEFSYQHDSVSDGDLFSANLDGGKNGFVWHLDGFDRSTDNYEIPGAAEVDAHEDEETGILENSFSDAYGYTAGLGWVTDDMRLAFAYGKLKNQYGVPGHGHAEEEEEHEEEGPEEAHEEETELVFAQLDQDRYQGMVDWTNLQGFVSEVHWHNAYTDYTHSEIEEAEIGTTFDNQTFESRLWAKHKPLSGWEGVFGLTYMDTDFSALGEEAFTPATDSQSLALFVMEEKRTGDLLWQLGGRVEETRIKPDNNFFAEEEEEHEGEEEEEHEEIFFDEASYTAVSLSAGLVWSLNQNSSFAVNLVRAERAPTAAEIFSNGPHIGTNAFELGAGFDIQVEGDEFEVVQADREVEKEVSTNLDLTYRFSGEMVEASFSLFYNQVDDYLFQQNTGFFADDGHGHGDEEEEEGHEEEEEHGHEEEEGELPVFIFRQQDAELYGFEVELDWHLNEHLRIETYADYTRAKLDDGGNLPRIPPLRVGMDLHWESDSWHAELGAVYYREQDDIAELETSTDGYTLVNAAFNYYLDLGGDAEVAFFVKGNNLTDREARVHSSFIKDLAPLPGRSLVVGTRVNF